jgi:hypothetical protein
MGIAVKARSLLSSVFPQGMAAYVKVKNRLGRYLWGETYAQKVFSRIYMDNVWRNPESRSGTCATHTRTEVVRQALPRLVKDLGVRTFLDAPCGDFNWMKLVSLGVDKYIGADIVPDLIARNQQAYGDGTREFRVLDITRHGLPAVDLILCRDCLVHLSFEQTAAAIANFKRSGSKYLLTTTYTATTRNSDIATGDCFMLNLELPPFGFPVPLRSIVEEPGRCLGLWRLADL